MFWGLQLEANLRYSQQVPEGFRITKATLSADSPPTVAKSQDPASKIVQVFVDQDGSDYAVATLKHGEIYDCSMDLRFAEGEDICFYLKGEGVVFLTGHNLYPDDACDDTYFPRNALIAGSSDEDVESSGDDDDDDDDEDEEDSEDDCGPDIEDITEAESKAKRNSKGSNGVVAIKKEPAPQAQKGVDEEDDDEDDGENDDAELDSADEEGSTDEDEEEQGDEDEEVDDEEEDEESDDAEDQEEYVKGKTAPGLKRTDAAAHLKSKAPEPKKAKLQNGTASTKRANGDAKRVSEAAKSSQGTKPSAANLTNDSVKELIVEDIRTGDGAIAKKGRILRVYYTGKLLNGEVFDAVKTGPPFQFKLGTASVIKGWDKGLEGMRVGGKRRLTIPPSMAYGKREVGPIPAGSVLKFDVLLKGIA